MTSNKDIPFAKSLIDYVFCWLGCQFIPGYADKNIPNRVAAPAPAESKNTTTARELVEKTRDLAQKIAEAKVVTKSAPTSPSRNRQDGSRQTGAGVEVKSELPTSQHSHEKSGRVEVLNPAISDVPAVRFTDLGSRIGALIVKEPVATDELKPAESEIAVMQQFNAQFEHFGDDAPACDICGSITVRNGTCYKCFNCGNSMGCS
jgi:ribonucleoside-diphosphate reductase alpha chain